MARVRRRKPPTFKQRLTQRVRRVLLNLHEGAVPLERVAAADLNALSSEDWLRDLAGVGEQEQEHEQEQEPEEEEVEKEEEKEMEKGEEEKKEAQEREDKEKELAAEVEREIAAVQSPAKEAPKKRPPKLIRKLQRKPTAGTGMPTPGLGERAGDASGAVAVRAEPAADMRIPRAAATTSPTAAPIPTPTPTPSTAPAKASHPVSQEDEPAAKRAKRKGGGMVSSILGDMSSLLGRSSTAGTGGPAPTTATASVPPAAQQWPARRTPLLPPSMQRLMRGRGRGRGGARGRGRGRGGRGTVVSAGGRVGGLLPRPMGSHSGSAGGMPAPPPYLAPKPMDKATRDVGRVYTAPTAPPPPVGGAGGGGYVPGMVASSMEARARYAPPAKATGASNMLAQYLKKSSSTATAAATGPTPRPFGAPPVLDGSSNGAPRPM